MRRRRPLVLLSIAAAAIAFLLVSLALARAVGVSDAEHSALTRLAKAEARGDGAKIASTLDDCAPGSGCAARAIALANRLRRPGEVTVLAFTASTGFALSGGRGVARVAWHAADGPPVVQCAHTQRTGNVVTGMHVHVTAIGAPINGDASCPGS